MDHPGKKRSVRRRRLANWLLFFLNKGSVLRILSSQVAKSTLAALATRERHFPLHSRSHCHSGHRPESLIITLKNRRLEITWNPKESFTIDQLIFFFSINSMDISTRLGCALFSIPLNHLDTSGTPVALGELKVTVTRPPRNYSASQNGEADSTLVMGTDGSAEAWG